MRISVFHTAIAGVTLAMGCWIFLYGSVIPFVRFSLGDFFVVMFIYSLIKAIRPDSSSFRLGWQVFLFALSIELLQLFGFPQLFDTSKAWVQIVLGSNFEWLDIVMYALGLITVITTERFFWKRAN